MRITVRALREILAALHDDDVLKVTMPRKRGTAKKAKNRMHYAVRRSTQAYCLDVDATWLRTTHSKAHVTCLFCKAKLGKK